jgi:hypothetical protein
MALEIKDGFINFPDSTPFETNGIIPHARTEAYRAEILFKRVSRGLETVKQLTEADASLADLLPDQRLLEGLQEQLGGYVVQSAVGAGDFDAEFSALIQADLEQELARLDG